MLRLGLVVLLLGASVAWPCTPFGQLEGLPAANSLPANAPAVGLMHFWSRPLALNLVAGDGGVLTLTRDAGEPHWPIQEFPLAPGQLVAGQSYTASVGPMPSGGFVVTAAATLPGSRPRLRFLGDRVPLMQCDTQWTNAVEVEVSTDAEWAPWRGLVDARFETASGLQAPVFPSGRKWYSSLYDGQVGVVCGGGPTWAKLHLRVLGTENDIVSEPLWLRCDCGVPCVPLASSPDAGLVESVDAGSLVSDAGPDATSPPRGCGCSSFPLGFMLIALAPLLRRSVAA